MFECDEARRYVDAWLDGELDPSAALHVEAHVARCSGCGEEAAMIRALKRSFAALREQDQAPGALRARVALALDAVDSAELNDARAVQKRKHAAGFVLAGAALAGIVLATGGAKPAAPELSQAASAGILPPVLEDIALRHARDLPSEVSGAQPEQVADFFRGRLDIPVRPVTFRGVSARLVGARISNVRDRLAAALYYDVGGRRVTVFMFDSALLPRAGGAVLVRAVGNQPVYVGNAHGYTVAYAEHGGVGYALASDLPTQDAVRIVEHVEMQ